MSLVIEAMYLLVRVSTINQRLEGGLDAFRALCPNRTFVTDGELAGCGFMSTEALDHFAVRLVENGFSRDIDGPDAEMVLADMKDGLRDASSWCVFERIPYPGRPGLTLATARLAGGSAEGPKAYEGWNPESNMNLDYQLSPPPALGELEYLGEKNGVDTYRHKVTGKLYYAGRGSAPPPGPRVRIIKRPDADNA